MNKVELIQKVNELSKLEKNWSSYHSSSLIAEAIVSAKQFIALLPDTIQTPFISPTSNGWLEFSWGDKKDTTFCILLEPGPVNYEFYFGTGDDFEEGLMPKEQIENKIFPLLQTHFALAHA